MIDTNLDAGFHNVLRMMRYVGQTMLRPAGLAAERRGGPIPVDDPMFVEFNRTGLTFGAVGIGQHSAKEESGIADIPTPPPLHPSIDLQGAGGGGLS